MCSKKKKSDKIPLPLSLPPPLPPSLFIFPHLDDVGNLKQTKKKKKKKYLLYFWMNLLHTYVNKDFYFKKKLSNFFWMNLLM